MKRHAWSGTHWSAWRYRTRRGRIERSISLRRPRGDTLLKSAWKLDERSSFRVEDLHITGVDTYTGR